MKARLTLIIVLFFFFTLSCDKQKSPETANSLNESQGALEPAPEGTSEVKDLAMNDKTSIENDSVLDANLQDISSETWVLANNQFALNVLMTSNSKENMVFSPYSFERALGMTAAGARGETRAEMLKSLGFKGDAKNLDLVGGEIESSILSGRNDKIELAIANRIYPEKSYAFLPAYLEMLAKNYNVSVEPLDFVNESEKSRVKINDWVSELTKERIKDLLPEGSIHGLVRMVLVNAMYFKAPWENQFPKELTKAAEFKGSEKRVQVETMELNKTLQALESQGYKALFLPYKYRDFGMLILLPSEDNGLDAMVKGLDANKISEILNGLSSYAVNLKLPKFKQTSTLAASALLQSLGMKLAFHRDLADFSAMDGTRELYLSNVFHKAFVEIDENGTEAAAATAAVMALRSALIERPEKLSFVVDHPFVFAIVHQPSQSILFLGRINQL